MTERAYSMLLICNSWLTAIRLLYSSSTTWSSLFYCQVSNLIRELNSNTNNFCLFYFICCPLRFAKVSLEAIKSSTTAKLIYSDVDRIGISCKTRLLVLLNEIASSARVNKKSSRCSKFAESQYIWWHTFESWHQVKPALGSRIPFVN